MTPITRNERQRTDAEDAERKDRMRLAFKDF
jgi:hypothetical protein